jgi:hypothetical protein
MTNNGDTNSFTGYGTPNPKLVIPRKNELDPANLALALSIEQWGNNLVSTGFAQLSHTYAWTGTVVVPSGATGYLPPFFMPVASNQSTGLYAVVTLLRAGTCDLNIEHNGSVIGATTASTTPTFMFIGAVVANNDTFQPVVTSVSSADGLTVSFYFAV